MHRLDRPIQGSRRRHLGPVSQHRQSRRVGSQVHLLRHLKFRIHGHRVGHGYRVLEAHDYLVWPWLPPHEDVSRIGKCLQNDRGIRSRVDIGRRIVYRPAHRDCARALAGRRRIRAGEVRQAQRVGHVESRTVLGDRRGRRHRHGIPLQGAAGELPAAERVLRPALGRLNRNRYPQRVLAARRPHCARSVRIRLPVHVV